MFTEKHVLRMNPAVAMGWPVVSGSFVPRLVNSELLSQDRTTVEGRITGWMLKPSSQ